MVDDCPVWGTYPVDRAAAGDQGYDSSYATAADDVYRTRKCIYGLQHLAANSYTRNWLCDVLWPAPQVESIASRKRRFA